MHRFGRNLAGILKLHIAVVTCRQRAHFVDHVHQHLRTVSRQALASHGVVGQHFFGRGRRRQECGKVTNPGNALGAANRHRLEIFRAHHRTDAGAASRTMQIIDDAGVKHTVLTGAANRANPGQRILMQTLDGFLGFPAALAPQVRRIAQLGLVVFQREINRFRGFALENNHVPAGVLQLGAKETAGIGAGDGIGQRALGHHRVAATG